MTNTLKTLKKRNTISTWAIVMACFFYFVPTLVMSNLWIETRSIFIENSYTDTETVMNVDREVKSNFYGHYTVTIYRNGDEFICQHKSPNSIFYSPHIKLPKPLKLSWWIGGKNQLEQCKGEGYGQGIYQINTCHIVLLPLWEIPIAKSCKMSNLFTRINRK